MSTNIQTNAAGATQPALEEVKVYRGRFLTEDGPDFPEIFRAESEFFGYHEDDDETGMPFVHDDEDGNWWVSEDDEEQDPSTSEVVAGPFSSEDEAKEACATRTIEREEEAEATSYKFALPAGWKVKYASDAESARSKYPQAAYRAEISLTNGIHTVTATGFSRGNFVSGSLAAEQGACVDAIESALAKISSGEFDE